jgi:hypothetical protein
VLNAFIKIETFADNFAAGARDDTADERTRTNLTHAPRREFERATHQAFIGVWSLESGVWSQSNA